MMRKYALALMGAALLLGAGAGVSLAYLTASQETVNRFGAVDTQIQIEEEFSPPGELKPGTVIPKEPSIKNTASESCYVRASICFTNSDAQALCDALSISSGWTKKEDGWYYWDSPLLPQASTAPLFRQIRIRGDAKGECPAFDVLVYAEAVCCGDKSAQEAWNDMDEMT